MITIQNADAALKDYYLEAVSAALNDNISPFFSAIEKNTDCVSGKDVKLAVVRGFSGNVIAGAEDGAEVIETLLYCFNAVEDELARKYIPLVTGEELYSSDDKFYYYDFSEYPIKIKSVKVDGKKVGFEVLTRYMVVKGKKIEVEYEYAPARKGLDDNSDYDENVGEYLIALGMAAEYAVINGEAEMADRWEKQYRAQLDGVQRSLKVCAHIPPRRWV